jgi:hypothetical protein
VVINRLAGVTASIATVRLAAGRCTCDAMTPVLPLLDQLAEQEQQP